MSKKTGLLKGLFGIVVAVAAVYGCKQGTEDPQSLAFKQKQADAYLGFLAAHPDSTGLRLLTAQKLDSVGRFQEALAQMDTLLKADSTKYGLWVVKGNILLDSADTTGAQIAFAKALTRYKGEEALLSQGIIYALQKKDTCLQIADQLFANPVYSNYIKGIYAAETMDTGQALSFLNHCNQLDPAFAGAYVAKARFWLKIGQTASAKAAVMEGLKHNQVSIDLLNTTGAVFDALKLRDSASVYYERSLKIKPYQPGIQQKISAS